MCPMPGHHCLSEKFLVDSWEANQAQIERAEAGPSFPPRRCEQILKMQVSIQPTKTSSVDIMCTNARSLAAISASQLILNESTIGLKSLSIL